jgi:hypothetical protein
MLRGRASGAWSRGARGHRKFLLATDRCRPSPIVRSLVSLFQVSNYFTEQIFQPADKDKGSNEDPWDFTKTSYNRLS